MSCLRFLLILVVVAAACQPHAPRPEMTKDAVDAGSSNGGVPKGEFTGYVPISNGRMHIARAMRGDIENGAQVLFLASGEVLSVRHHVDGVSNGAFVGFYAGGVVAQMGNMRADKKHGIWRSFDKEGRQTQEATFVDGILTDGEWEGP